MDLPHCDRSTLEQVSSNEVSRPKLKACLSKLRQAQSASSIRSEASKLLCAMGPLPASSQLWCVCVRFKLCRNNPSQAHEKGKELFPGQCIANDKGQSTGPKTSIGALRCLESLLGRRCRSPCQVEICIFHSNIPHLSGIVWTIAWLPAGKGGIEAGVQDRGVLPVAAYRLELAHNVQFLRGPDVDAHHSTAPAIQKNYHTISTGMTQQLTLILE